MDRRRFMLSAAALTTPSLLPAAEPIKLRDLYGKGRDFSDLALAQEGKRLSVTGFMAPPLKPDLLFFVLTKLPMAVCPFCETEAEWPNDILAVYTKRPVRMIPFNVKISATGRLALGGYKDPDTGFVSRLRLIDATYG